MMLTQKTIAKKLGVSVSLVSRALSGTAFRIGASPETIRNIQEMARKLNYAPNLTALSLRGSRSSSALAIIKDFNDPFFGTMMKSINDLTLKRSLSLFLSSVPESKSDFSMLERLNPNIILICGSGICSGWVNRLLKTGANCIQIGKDKNMPRLKRVFVDDDFGIELLLNHFIKLGHRNFLFTGIKDYAHKSRFQILQEKIRSIGDKSIKLQKTQLADDYTKIAPELEVFIMNSNRKLPSAIIAADDLSAIETISFLRKKGILVPDTISVSGFDNIDFISKYYPSVTSVGLDMQKIVEKAFEIADKKILNKKCINVALKPKIFIRESIKKIN